MGAGMHCSRSVNCPSAASDCPAMTGRHGNRPGHSPESLISTLPCKRECHQWWMLQSVAARPLRTSAVPPGWPLSASVTLCLRKGRVPLGMAFGSRCLHALSTAPPGCWQGGRAGQCDWRKASAVLDSPFGIGVPTAAPLSNASQRDFQSARQIRPRSSMAFLVRVAGGLDSKPKPTGRPMPETTRR